MERLYHYLWKFKMFGKHLEDSDGNDIEVIDPGCHNENAGPDFFNAKIKINGVIWVGNVEIHVKASDWHRHSHHRDPAYDNIILHVVGISDCPVKRADGSTVPQVVITMPENFYKTLGILSENIDKLRCARHVNDIPDLNKTDWLETLMIERVQQKAAHILEILDMTKGDWEQTCFISLARALGFGINSDPFEMLAKSVPLQYLHHHNDNIFQLEALLLGQAGMLDSSVHILDEYYQTACAEYYFLARKYGLKPLNIALWKYSKTRPQNFPHRRIAFLAKTCENGFSLFSKIKCNSKDVDNLAGLFRHELEGYWKEHFSFDTEAMKAPASLSASSIMLIIINMVVPLLYANAARTDNPEQGEKAINILYSLKPENNVITRLWESAGIKPKNAAESQALIELKKKYCDTRKCLYCRFGVHYLKTSSN